MSKPIRFPSDTFSGCFGSSSKAVRSLPHAFPSSAVDPKADAVSIDLTDSGLVAEPWELVEIDERAAVAVKVVGSGTMPDLIAGRCLVKPYRVMIAAYRARLALA